MTNSIVKSSTSTYYPAVPEVIARPGYCTQVETVVARVVYRNDASLEINSSVQYDIANYGSLTTRKVVGPFSTTIYYTATFEVCFPAVAYVPGRDSYTETSLNVGWNAGGRSKIALGGDLYASFLIPASAIGVACGLAHISAPTGELGSIRHGILVNDGLVRVIERGVEVANSGIDIATAPAMSIRRVGNVVTYHVNSWSYTSTQPSSGEVVLSAVLYTGGDTVDSPILAGLNSLSAQSAWGWDDWQTAYSLAAQSAWGWGGSAAINDGYGREVITLDMIGSDYEYSIASLVLDGIAVSGKEEFVRVSSAGISTVVPLGMVGIDYSIDVDSFSATLDFPEGVGADFIYGDAILVLDGFAVRGLDYQEAPGTGTFGQILGIGDIFSLDPVLVAVMTDGITIGETFDLMLIIDGFAMDYLVHSDTMSPNMVIEALIESGVVFADTPSTIQEAAAQYATNLQTGAVGRYQGYDFLGFTEIGMDTYGWKADGLYKLGEPVSEDSPLSAFVEFAAEDFGTTLRKRVDTVFIGTNADGELLVKMTGDDTPEVVYCARQYGPTARANMGKGFTSRHWRMRLDAIEVTQADIDAIEWVVMPTTRRTTR